VSDLFVGLVLGAIVATPVVFVGTAMGAAKVWRCVPCAGGKPIEPDTTARIVDAYTRGVGR
jgi:hypothetical protein